MTVANDIRDEGNALVMPLATEVRAGTFEAATYDQEPQSLGAEPQPPSAERGTGAHDLHSANGKLLAVIQELQARNDELARANIDLNSLIAGTGIGILFLDGELRIRRYTPCTAAILDLVPADVGRPFTEVAGRLKPGELAADAVYAVRDRVAVERELRGNDGRFYRVRLQPRRAAGDQVDGVTLTFADISERERHDEETRSLNAELEHGKAYAESIIATVREPMLVLDEGLRVVTASRAFYRDFGTTPEITQGELLFDLGDRQWDIPELRRLLDDVLPDRATVEAFEVRHDFGAGERIMLLNARRLRQAAGLEPLILLAFEDVTERTRAKEALAASEQKYRALFDSIDEGFCIFEMLFDDLDRPVDYRFLEVNAAFYRNTGLADAQGRTIRELVPEHEQYWFDIYGSVATSGESARFEQRGEGMHRTFDVYAFRVDAPEQRRVAALFTDISERKRVERAVTRLASIVDSSDDAIISKNLDGVVTSWNQAAEAMFGYGADEAIGHSIASLIIPEDRQCEEDDILARLAIGETVDHFETVRRRKDGTTLEISATISPLRNSEGRIIGASKIARDITERKRHERHRELLVHELNHRVKNTLASVQALAAQTFRSREMRGAVVTFEARLLAMSAAHDVLTRQSWQGAGIGEIVHNAVAAWAGKGTPRVEVDGPELRLRPGAALALAMALHELTTNAAKYGALSNKAGRIAIRWSVSGDPAVFHLQWRECDGPAVQEPTRRGFGSRLIEYGLAQDLGGSVKLSFNEGGVECAIEAPLEEIREEDAA